MEAVLHEAEESLKSQFEAKLDQQLKILRDKREALLCKRRDRASESEK
jgi:hypothetical protein